MLTLALASSWAYGLWHVLNDLREWNRTRNRKREKKKKAKEQGNERNEKGHDTNKEPKDKESKRTRKIEKEKEQYCDQSVCLPKLFRCSDVLVFDLALLHLAVSSVDHLPKRLYPQD